MEGKRVASHAVEVRFADIDAMGHVNNAVYLSYFEQARMAWFADLIGGTWNWETDGIVLARNEIDYLEPVLLSDKVRIQTACIKVGGSSMVLAYEVYRLPLGAHEERLCTRGQSVLVCFDYTSGKNREVPQVWRERLGA
jgi:acyl-CoA thioester hydrolase